MNAAGVRRFAGIAEIADGREIGVGVEAANGIAGDGGELGVAVVHGVNSLPILDLSCQMKEWKEVREVKEVDEGYQRSGGKTERLKS
jgi:hypothetical protein